MEKMPNTARARERMIHWEMAIFTRRKNICPSQKILLEVDDNTKKWQGGGEDPSIKAMCCPLVGQWLIVGTGGAVYQTTGQVARIFFFFFGVEGFQAFETEIRRSQSPFSLFYNEP